MSSGAMQMEKLNGENYSTWVMQMKSFLITQDLWSAITTRRPTEESQRATWTATDQKALATITLCVKPSELLHIKNCKTA